MHISPIIFALQLNIIILMMTYTIIVIPSTISLHKRSLTTAYMPASSRFSISIVQTLMIMVSYYFKLWWKPKTKQQKFLPPLLLHNFRVWIPLNIIQSRQLINISTISRIILIRWRRWGSISSLTMHLVSSSNSLYVLQ